MLLIRMSHDCVPMNKPLDVTTLINSTLRSCNADIAARLSWNLNRKRPRSQNDLRPVQVDAPWPSSTDPSFVMEMTPLTDVLAKGFGVAAPKTLEEDFMNRRE